MTTAMQELIEFMEGNSFYYSKGAHKKANELLEKEKQQIVDAWQHGDSSIEAISAEQYYAKTYTQYTNKQKQS